MQSVFAETFGGVTAVAFSPDGKCLATSDTTGAIQLWDVPSGRQLVICKGHKHWTWDVAFSPDGQFLVSASDDYLVKLWDVHTGDCLKTFVGHTDSVNAIASSTMDKLATFKPETRQTLGNYRRTNYDQWLAALGEAGAKNSPRLDALADSCFFQLFPNQKGKSLNPRTFGQVWYAIADEQLGAAKAQKPLTTQPHQTSGNGANGNRSL